MPFKGVTFSGQNVTPKNDGGLYNAHYGDGILWGCSMNISGDDLVIQSGEFIMGGRVVQVDGATNVDLSGRSLTTGYIQVVMNADLTQGEGSQWYTTFVESATTTFPALTQDDINNTGTLYQMQMAVVQISGGNLTGISGIPYDSRVIYQRGANQLEIVGPDNYKAIRSSHNNTYYGGIAFDDTGSYPQTEIFAEGGSIVIRPNGQSNPTKQIIFDSSGQIVGGCLTNTHSTAGSINLPANTNTAIASVNIGAGVFVVTATCLIYGAGASSPARADLGVGVGSPISESNTSIMLNTAVQYRLRAKTTHILSTNSASVLSAYVNPQAATSCTDRYISVAQIG